MQFKDIDGQRVVINRLTEIIDSGRVSHAQMIVGGCQGDGLQLAVAYMQYLSCQHRQHYAEGDLRADSCGQCPSCKKIAAGVHPDLLFVYPTATTTSVKKDPSSEVFATRFREFAVQTQWRGSLNEWYGALGVENKQGMIRERDADAVVERLAVKPYEGGWKMCVVWMADKMNLSFDNKLLKTLEEPTGQTVIMLVCDTDQPLLATIKSRVQTLRLAGDAASALADADDGFAPMLVAWLRQLFKLRMKELAAEVDKLSALNREQLKRFLLFAQEVVEDCYMCHMVNTPSHLNSGDERFDANFPTMITANNVEAICNALNEAQFAIERNAYVKIALMQLSFAISKALKRR